MHLGLAQGLVPTDPTELTPQRAEQLAGLEIDRVVTHFEVAPGHLAGDRGRVIADRLHSAGLRVAQCGGIDSRLASRDADARRRTIDELRMLLRSARALQAEMVLSGAGSSHPTHPYGPHPDNHSPAARAWLVDALREVAVHAEEVGVPIALECHVLTTLNTPAQAREILDEVDSPFVLANFDPVNFLGSVAAVYDSGALAEQAAAILAPRLAPAVHIKDVRIDPELVVHVSEAAPGTGIMDLPAVLRACGEHMPPDSTLVVEHLGPRESAAALRVVAALAEEAGLRSVVGETRLDENG